MTKPRQLAPTMGLAHGGDEFLKGSFLGFKKFAIFRLKPAWKDSSVKIKEVISGGIYKIEIAKD